MTFFLSCRPPTATHHHKRIVRVGGFSKMADKPELVAAKQFLDVLLIPHRPVKPLARPAELRLAFTWPWRKAEPKKNRVDRKMWHTSRPDCTNVAKTVEDALVRNRFIEDDGGNSRVVIEKFWGDEPGIQITIEEL